MIRNLLPTNRAIFLDRDGVLNRNIPYQDTGAFESPRTPCAVELTCGVGPALRSLVAAGYRLILVSNQPNAAKGKCSLATLEQIHGRILELLASHDIQLDACFYCYHHPQHTGSCACRKPAPFFLHRAAENFGLDLKACWMIGDRASDVACGRAAGSRTLWIDNAEGEKLPPEIAADEVARSVPEGVARILEAQDAAS